MSNLNINEDAQSGGEFSGSQSSFTEGNHDDSPRKESAFPDEDEETITMLDVIEREDKLEEEASAVLGNSDEKNCTYPKGYIPRQALYSCATCFNESGKEAAICLACSLECHDNHEVYELYTKRNYRCDCGNSRFSTDFECKLMDKQQKKALINENNTYNHNFSGKYCVCDRQYPPDEHDESPESNDEMWQCIICEDWYHTRHLGASKLPNKFDELICSQCVDKLDFLHFYKHLDKLQKYKVAEIGSEEGVSKTEPSQRQEPEAQEASDDTRKDVITESDTNDSQSENKDPIQASSAQKQSQQTSQGNICILNEMKQLYKDIKLEKEPIFWNDCNWREELCKCQKCIEMYEAKGCSYLIDDKDTVQYYEAQGKALAGSQETPLERGMSALNRMNRAAVVEALHGYDELKADLSVYLRKFADSKKVVREEDIHEFFQQLRSKKRPRFEE